MLEGLAWLGLPGDKVKFAAWVPSGKEDLPGLFLNNFFTLCLLEYHTCTCACVSSCKTEMCIIRINTYFLDSS